MIITALVIFVQLIGSYLLFFIVGGAIFGALSSPSNFIVDNGWGPALFGIIGVWGVGLIAARLRGQQDRQIMNRRLIGTIIGALVGWLILALGPPTGFAGIFIPIILAILGYYLFPLIRR